MADPTRQKPSVARGVYSRCFAHGVTWYIRYSVGGRTVRERIGREIDGVTRTLAKDALKARLGDLVRGRFRLPEARRPILVRMFVKRYRAHAEATKRGYTRERYTLDALEREFGGLAFAELSAFRIERWKAARKKRVAPATVNRELTVLKHMLATAV